ncbi:hypothetical protein CB0940_10406 [Cercospora beticola]|uniref:Uncharacterized protein n=2 Tax=Cercospora beticola TaxID=122368 RepID=A0A2G5HV68_CERBT|nr:hypothetical protein CB0940_10406 [Cercospora beticola]PIA96429.1 hypothetical protein CB0940_10406 [Cercospora beticola]CAK1367076.1 unnamed protein product [Cercospora beticola]
MLQQDLILPSTGRDMRTSPTRRRRRLSTASSSSSSTTPPTSPSLSPSAAARGTMSSSASSSASASPTLEASARGSSTLSTPLPRPRKVSSQSHIPEAIPEDEVPDFKLQYSCCSSTMDQDPLAIKANLTEMLNCEQVRNDQKMRLWIQSRLMDAELELKRQRRRRVSLPTPDLVLDTGGTADKPDECS